MSYNEDFEREKWWVAYNDVICGRCRFDEALPLPNSVVYYGIVGGNKCFEFMEAWVLGLVEWGLEGSWEEMKKNRRMRGEKGAAVCDRGRVTNKRKWGVRPHKGSYFINP